MSNKYLVDQMIQIREEMQNLNVSKITFKFRVEYSQLALNVRYPNKLKFLMLISNIRVNCMTKSKKDCID